MKHRIRGTVGATTLLALMITPGLRAQSTNDVARLVVGISGGFITSHSLWSTTQPIRSLSTSVDTFRLVRSIRSNVTLAAHLTYFGTPRFGITGEVSYLGLGTEDGCLRLTSLDDAVNRLACNALQGQERSASAVGMMAGGVWRLIPTSDVIPYLKAMVGLAITPSSTTTMNALFGHNDEFALQIYADDDSKSLAPIGAAAFGFSTAANNGYQFSVEARATAVRLRTVAGPAPLGSLDPPIESEWVVLPSVTLRFDIVLERRRGRRY